MPNNINPATSSNVPQAHIAKAVQQRNQVAQAHPNVNVVGNVGSWAITPFQGSSSSSVNGGAIEVTHPSGVQGHAVTHPSGGGSGSRGLSITESPSSTGLDQLPGSIQNQLQSGHMLSWTNPNTGQTFYAPHTVNGSNEIWVSGPTGNGPISEVISGQPIQITAPMTTVKYGKDVLYHGLSSTAPSLQFASGNFQGFAGQNQQAQVSKPSFSGLSSVDYYTFGSTANLTWEDVHSGTFYLTVDLPNGQTFTYGTQSNPMQVYGVSFGTINAQDQAIEQAWGAYMTAQESLQNVPAGSALTVTQGSNGLNMNINTAPTSSLPTQTLTLAPGLTVTSPSNTALIVSAAPLLNSATVSKLDPTKTYTSDGVNFTGAQLQSVYNNYETQFNSFFQQQNPTVTVGGTTAPYNSLTSDQQQQYVQQQVDQYTGNEGYKGSGYYNANGITEMVTTPSFYDTLLKGGMVGNYIGTTPPTLGSVSTPTFISTPPSLFNMGGSASLMLPQGWSVDPKTGDLSVNNNPPTLQQSEQYAKAYAQYLNWYESNPMAQAQNTQTGQQGSTSNAPTPVPNWYNMLTTVPSGGMLAADLAALQYAPLAPTITPQAQQTPLQQAGTWLGQSVINPVETALAPAGKAVEDYVIKPAESAVSNYMVKPYEQYVVQPAEQFGQGVLNTQIPSLQTQRWLQEMLPLYSFHTLPKGIAQTGQAPTAQAQQPTTIGSLLDSAGTLE